MKHCFLNPFRSQLLGLFFSINSLIIFYEKRVYITLRRCSLCGVRKSKKLSGEKTDAKAIRFAIQNYATLNDRYIETQRQIRTWKDKYAALNKAVDDYLSSFEALKKTTD